MSKHTPGPWTLEKQRPGQVFTAIGEPIAVIGGEATDENVEFVVGRTCDYGPHGDAQTTANAHLIAAAPELLEACLDAMAWMAVRQHDAKIMGRLRAAIARAEGRA